MDDSRRSIYLPRVSPGVGSNGSSNKPSKFKVKRRQTFHSQRRHGGMFSTPPMHFEVAELIRKPASNLSVPRIIPQQRSGSVSGSTRYLNQQAARSSLSTGSGSGSFLTVNPVTRPSSVESMAQQRRPSCYSTASSQGESSLTSNWKNRNFLCPLTDVGSAKARIPSPELSSDTSPVVSGLVSIIIFYLKYS